MTTEMIRGEFGGGHPFYLSNYYAGGPFVRAGTQGFYGPIPSGGAISLAHFFGARRALDVQTLVAGDNGQGLYGFIHPLMGITPCGSLSDGTCDFLGNNTYTGIYQWNGVGPFIQLVVWGNHVGNTDWNKFSISGTGTEMQRTLASDVGFNGSQTYWTWYLTGGEAFFTPGNAYTVTFL